MPFLQDDIISTLSTVRRSSTTAQVRKSTRPYTAFKKGKVYEVGQLQAGVTVGLSPVLIFLSSDATLSTKKPADLQANAFNEMFSNIYPTAWVEIYVSSCHT